MLQPCFVLLLHVGVAQSLVLCSSSVHNPLQGVWLALHFSSFVLCSADTGSGGHVDTTGRK